jgi:hypothetical protein
VFKTPETVSRIERPDARTLRMTAADRPYLSGVLGLIAFPPHERYDAVTTGVVVPANGYRVEFTRVEPFGEHGEPCLRTITFHFDKPFDTPGNVFLRFTGGRLERMAFD